MEVCRPQAAMDVNVPIGITLDTHSHVMPGMQGEAAEKIGAGLRAALAG